MDNSSAINEVSQLINQSNDLIRLTTPNDHVNNTAEVVMDAQVMQMGHEIVGEIVNRVCTLEFSTEEYCAAIVSDISAPLNDANISTIVPPMGKCL